MQSNKMPYVSQYSIITVKEPVVYDRTVDEAWLLNPVRRYIFNARSVAALNPHIETISDLEGSSHYKRLNAGVNVTGARILIERYRDRGIGDLLFLTGPLSFLRHISGGQAKVYAYALSDRGFILQGHPGLAGKTVMCGPLHYDDLPLYHYHWFIPSVTECNEEHDQDNVYDALYRSMGFEPEKIDAKFKRPSLFLDDSDLRALDQFFYTFGYSERHMDLRRIPYYVVAPFAAASVRSLAYSTWLEIIKALVSTGRPVVVVGRLNESLPATNMSAGAFNEQLNRLSQNMPIINALGRTRNVRLVAALISRAQCTVCLDSAPLYIAQAVRAPAVSLWGSHHPGARIGYDEQYMKLAVYKDQACLYSPCFAYSSFPAHKCPKAERQCVCEPLEVITAEDVMAKVKLVETGFIEPIAPGKP